MITNVPFISKEDIERDAAALLAEFARERGIILAPPIPIDDIIEKHLKLKIEFDDTHRLFGILRTGRKADILGVIIFNERRIVIDESLDPDVYPAKKGCYRFSLGHEGGHWRLHRPLFISNPGLINVFSHPVPPPSGICRSSQARSRIEWQADYYAACLLMPRELVFAEWNKVFPDGKPRVIQPHVHVDHDLVEVSLKRNQVSEFEWLEWINQVFNCIARPLAEVFHVSPIAMRIRLESLGLLLREVPYQHLRIVGA